MSYELIDSGLGEKWERFGDYSLVRPCPQAVWSPEKATWDPDGVFSREGGNRWTFQKKLPASWMASIEGIQMKIAPTDFGHLGVFPEHAALWKAMQRRLTSGMRVLNLFAYSGAATLAAAQKGASVCHLDASKGMVDWARENGRLNRLDGAPIRWIVDDALKFLKREEKRESFYDGILLDPPTFGRGSKGEVFMIERDILPLLEACRAVLSKRPNFVMFSCHTPGMTPVVLGHLLRQVFKKEAETGEMLLTSANALSIPSGSYGKIIYD